MPRKLTRSCRWISAMARDLRDSWNFSSAAARSASTAPRPRNAITRTRMSSPQKAKRRTPARRLNRVGLGPFMAPGAYFKTARWLLAQRALEHARDVHRFPVRPVGDLVPAAGPVGDDERRRVG